MAIILTELGNTMRLISAIVMLQFAIVGCRAQQPAQNANEGFSGNSDANLKVSRPLFDGNRIKVVAGTSRGQVINSNEGKNSCFSSARSKIEAEFKIMGISEEMQYFRFANVQLNESEPSRNQLDIPEQEFSGTSMESFKAFDTAIMDLDFLSFYVIRAKAHRFLLATGHDPATSGYGHYYRIHLLVPLGSGGPITEFASLTSDPQKIGIDVEGRLLIAQIDSVRQGAVDVENDTPLPIVVHIKRIGDSAKSVTFKSTCTTADLEGGIGDA